MKSGQPTGDPIQSTDPSRRDPNKVYEVHTNKLEKAREAYQKAKQSVAQFFPAYRTPSSFSDPPTVMDVFQTLLGANPGPHLAEYPGQLSLSDYTVANGEMRRQSWDDS